MSKLILIDGNSLLYRGFFAMRALTASDGLPTNALFALANMLLTLKEREKPERMVCAWDAPTKTFRHLEYEAYKGTRQETPDELRQQSPVARELVKSFGIDALEIDGFEADDILGTLARKGKALGYEVLIVTGDLDALQLVEENVRVMTTIKGVTDVTYYDEPAVRARYGLEPAQLTDYRALKGDPSDNIPGVPGIGEKTASKLLQEFGTIEAIEERLSEVTPPRIRDLIDTNREQMRLSKRLAIIECNVPLGWELPSPGAAPPTTPDSPVVRALFERLEFRAMLKRVDGLTKSSPADDAGLYPDPFAPETLPENATERVVKETRADYPDALFTLIADARAAKTIALRCDSTGDSGHECVLHGVAVAIAPGDVRYVPVENDPASAETLGGLFDSETQQAATNSKTVLPTQLIELLEDSSVSKITHDARTEIATLARHGANLAGLVFDTELAAYLLQAGRRAGFPIDVIASDMAGIKLPALPDKKEQKTLEGGELLDRSRAFSVAGADALFALRDVLSPKLDAAGSARVLTELELPVAPILAEMERVGVKVDTDILKAISDDMAQKVKALEIRIHELAGGPFLIGSTKQLQEVLFEKLGLPSGKKTKTGFSTDADVLDELAGEHEIVAKILNWRELSKLKSTYADAMPLLVKSDGRIHTSLNQTVAATGRLSSSNPNLQNIPIRTEIGREIRRAFIAENGRVLLSCDYSQIELRLFAHVSEDAELRAAFGSGEDIHRYTAGKMYGVEPKDVTTDMRRAAKTVNYAVIYGISDFALARQLKIPFADAKELKASYFRRFPGVRTWLDDTIEFARQKGYVETLYGRRRYLPDIQSRVFSFRQASERAAANMPIQGSSADIMKRAMIDVFDAIEGENLPATLLLQVHDELLLEVDPDAVSQVGGRVRSLMEGAGKLAVRLEVEVKTGKSWADVTPLPDEEA